MHPNAAKCVLVTLVSCLAISAPVQAQAAGDPDDTDTALTDRATNAAEPSLERSIGRAMAAVFSPLGLAPDEDAQPAQDQAQDTGQPQTKPQTKPQAPSLKDLGFPVEQTKGNPQEQARLDKRSHMLKIHQRMGLITTGPLIATVLTGSFAGGRRTSSTDRNLHAALGSVTAGLYIATAYYAIFAPKIAGTPTRGPIRLHKALAWIHGPGMILTPILGAMAYQQKSRGERVHGIAKAHGAVGVVTAGAFGLAIASVSFRF